MFCVDIGNLPEIIPGIERIKNKYHFHNIILPSDNSFVLCSANFINIYKEVKNSFDSYNNIVVVIFILSVIAVAFLLSVV